MSSTGKAPRRRRAVRRTARLLRHPSRIVPAVRRRVVGPPAPPPRPAPAPPPEPTPQERALAREAQARSARFGIITQDLDLTGLGLEIGPSHNPLLPKAGGYNIRTADHLDQAGLQTKYEGQRPTGKIEPVDYVLAPGRLTASISEEFDYIVASHVAEHTVCLVSFLQDCQALLRDGGVLSLALPDKRYCFDRFRDRTPLGRVIDVYRAAPSVHSEGSVLEHNLNTVSKAHRVNWSPQAPGSYDYRYNLDQVRARADSAVAGQYVDTHNWVLTPNHFRLLMADLHTLGLLGLRERSFHDTAAHEFFITLSADAPGPGLTREELTVLADRELRLPEDVEFA